MKLHYYFLIITFLILYTQSVFSQETSLNITFEDGYRDTLNIIDNNPNNIQTRYMMFGVFNFRLISYGEMSSAAGPFGLDFKYQKFLKKTNQMFEFSFFFTPLEMEVLDDNYKYDAFPTTIEFNYRKKFASKFKSKKKSLGLFNSKLHIVGSNSYTIHIIDIPINYAIKYYFRLGTHYNQYPDGQKFGVNDSFLELHSVKSASLYIGISKMKIGSIHYQSKGFGKQRVSWLKDLYLDFIYSPLLYGYGIQTGIVNNQSVILQEGKLDFEKKLERYPFGFRLGNTSKFSAIKSKNSRFGHEVSYELAYLSGIANHYFYLSASYKILFKK